MRGASFYANLGRVAGTLTQARTEPVAEHDIVGKLPKLAGVHDDTVRTEGLRERVPVVGLHVVLRTSTVRLVRPNDHARGLDDVMFRRDRPEVVDPVRAGSAQLFSPAAIVKEQHPAPIFQHSFMTRRHGDATRVNVLAGSARSFSPAAIGTGSSRLHPNVNLLMDVSQSHETNHAVHRRIVANRRRRRSP